MWTKIKGWWRKNDIGEYLLVAAAIITFLILTIFGMWLDVAVKGAKFWIADKMFFGGSIFDFLGSL